MLLHRIIYYQPEKSELQNLRYELKIWLCLRPKPTRPLSFFKKSFSQKISLPQFIATYFRQVLLLV